MEIAKPMQSKLSPIGDYGNNTRELCPVCSSTETTSIIDLLDIPIHCNLIWDMPSAALEAPRGDIRLHMCHVCGHLFNSAFNMQHMEYTQDYENSLHASPRFQAYAEAQAESLIEQYDLQDNTIIDIGCGKGEFLQLLCERGTNHGVGFDPSYDPTLGVTSRRVDFVQDFYSEQHSDRNADLIVCRHVLEHIDEPMTFLEMIRRTTGNHVTIFFEVPNAMFTLRDLGIWDLIYEHCSYFTAHSLGWAFRQAGFAPLNVQEPYDRQFLTIEARPASAKNIPTFIDKPEISEIVKYTNVFADAYRRTVTYWKQHLVTRRANAERVVIWGAGSKGVTFLNTLRHIEAIDYAVDINPRKQGKFIAGSGQEIVAPDFLRTYRPDLVIVMNPIYQEEIGRELAQMGVSAQLVTA
jgi:SAM-dependent methyltransferase